MFKHICVHTSNTANDNVLLSHVVKKVEEIVLLENLCHTCTCIWDNKQYFAID